MSTEALVESPNGVVLAAWETEGQVYYARLDPVTRRPRKVIAAPGTGAKRKHPTLAVQRNGEVLLAWAEGTGWQRGGALAWQVFDAQDRPTEHAGRIPNGISVWDLPAAYARPDSGFVLLH